MITRDDARRIGRRGAAHAAALAALAALGCAAPPVQPPATRESLARLARAHVADVYGRRVALSDILSGGAVLYFFRTDCEYCVRDLAAAPALAAQPGAPAVVLVSRESAARLRGVMGPSPRPGLVLVSDSGGALMDSALVTRFVPRIVAVSGFRVLLDRTGRGDAGLAEAAHVASRGRGR